MKSPRLQPQGMVRTKHAHARMSVASVSLFWLLGIGLGLLFPVTAWAQGGDIMGIWASVAEGSISQKLVVSVHECLDEALIEVMLVKMYDLFQSFIAACCLLAIILLGWRITTGQTYDPRSDAALTAVKVGLVALFAREMAYQTELSESIVVTMYNVVDELVVMVSSALPDSLFVQGCQIELYDDEYRIWRDLDCLLVNFMAFSAIGAGASALVGFLISNVLSGYIGIQITVLGIAALSGMVFSILRATYLYVSSLISISFMLCFAPLFIPALLFQATRQYFDKWLGLCIGHILQPMLVTAYLCIMLGLYEQVLFRNETSIAKALLGHTVDSPVQFNEFFSIVKQTVDDRAVGSAGRIVEAQNVKGATAEECDTANLGGFIAEGWKDYMLRLMPAEGDGACSSRRGMDPFGGIMSTDLTALADVADYNEFLEATGQTTTQPGTPERENEIIDKMREIMMSFTIFMLVVFANFSLLQVLEQITKKLSAISARVSVPFVMSFESSFNRALFGSDYYAFAGRGDSSFLSAAMSQSSWLPGMVQDPERGSLAAYRYGLDAALMSANLPFGMGEGIRGLISNMEAGEAMDMAQRAINSGDPVALQAARTALQGVAASSPGNTNLSDIQQLLAEIDARLRTPANPSNTSGGPI